MVDIKLPLVIEMDGPPFEKIQCECPASELRELGWKGYRERRSQMNGQDPKSCMRHAKWIVGNDRLCTQHAGMRLLQKLKSGTQGDLI